MDKIKAYDDRAMRKSTRIASLIMGVVLIALGFFSTVKYSAIIGVVLIAATIMQKNTYISKDGIDIEYDFILYKHVISWKFDEITDIHIEDVPDRRFQVLYFLREVMTRRLVFRRDEIERVLEMAKTCNEKIHVEYVD
ncbi:hypothetical protein M2140_001870 [Clostridiales Family XIII bacterium PM5-7]